MKPITLAVALAFGASVLTSLAAVPVQPSPTWPKTDPATYVDEPVASARSGGEGSDVANAIVQALNADAELKNAKITVQPEPEKDLVLLTGVVPTRAQSAKAAQIASAQSNGMSVTNALQIEEVFVDQTAGQVAGTNGTPAAGDATSATPSPAVPQGGGSDATSGPTPKN